MRALFDSCALRANLDEDTQERAWKLMVSLEQSFATYAHNPAVRGGAGMGPSHFRRWPLSLMAVFGLAGGPEVLGGPRGCGNLCCHSAGAQVERHLVHPDPARV